MSRNYELLNAVSSRNLVRPARMKVSAPQVHPVQTKAASTAPADLMYLLLALRRHWPFGVGFLMVVVAVTAAITFLSPSIYEPTAKIEVDPPGTELFTLQSASAGSTDIDRIIETQTQILNSDELSIKAIRELRLDQRPAVAGKHATASAANTGDRLSSAESAALQYVRKHLKAAPVKNSRTIDLSFASPDPALSRDIVNTVLHLYLNKNYQTRFDAVTQSSEWLARQLVDIRKKAEQSNRTLAEYQKTHNIADVGDQQSTFALKVGELSRQLTQAGADRIQFEAFEHAIREGNGDSLPQVRDSPVIQDLAKNIAKTQTELSQTEVIYGKNHPNVQKLNNAVATLETQLRRERDAILTGIHTSYAAAHAREQLIGRQLQAATAGAGAVGEYSVLKHEAQANTDLYNTLYARVKEAGITAASKSSNVRVLEEARLLDRPTRPVPMQNMALALVFGLVGGIATIFLRDHFDPCLRSPDELSQVCSLPAVTFVPQIAVGRHPALNRWAPALLPGPNTRSVIPFVSRTPNSNAAEAIRTLVSSLLTQEPSPRVILVSSAFPREGKTTVAVNLAFALSDLSDTCIVDADLRRPSVAATFGVDLEPGLGTFLRGGASFDVMFKPCPTAPRLQIVPAGRAALNPGAALLGDAVDELVQELRRRFRFVVIDSPPILSYADGRALAPLTDGVILVGRYGYTARAGVERCIDVVRELRANVLAFVFNSADTTADYGYYGYRRDDD